MTTETCECGGKFEVQTEHTCSSNGDGYGKTESWEECNLCGTLREELN